MLLVNLLLALAWAAVRGDVGAASLGTGFVLGFVVLWLLRVPLGSERYVGRVARALGLCGFFLWELVLANLRVARIVLTPGYRMRSGIVAVPLDVTSDAQITLLANMITLTPGTLSLDVSPDRRTLYMHTMEIDDLDAVRRGIKQGFERRILELLA